MIKYLSRACPRCKDRFRILVLPHTEKTINQVVDGYCWRCGYELHWLSLAGGMGATHNKVVNGPWLRLAASNPVKHQGPVTLEEFS
jgi:hypothetical protein